MPSGIPCQKSIESTPATLKISEKAMKYHFLPRKSMFGLRKNSKPKPQFSKFQGFEGCKVSKGTNPETFGTLKSKYSMLRPPACGLAPSQKSPAKRTPR